METTLTLDDAVMRELREEAARRGTTLSALVETAVRRILAERPAPKPETGTDELPPLPTWSGEPLVDVADRDALYEALDDEQLAPKQEADELPPLPTWNSGGAKVDVADRKALYELIDAERDVRLYGKSAY